MSEPASRAADLPISGSRVRLRDHAPDDADLLDAWSADPVVHGEFNDFGTERRPIDRDTLAKGPYRNERNGQLIVERIDTGAPIGSVGWRKERYGPTERSEAWNIGISLIPEARGLGFGAEALRLLADYSSQRPRSIASKPRRTSTTSPNSDPSRRAGSSARASSAARSSAAGLDTTW